MQTNLRLLFLGGLTLFGVSLCCYQTLMTWSSSTRQWPRWAYAEWLINYSGGFVRRGLPGEIIQHIVEGGPASFWINLFIFAGVTTSLVLWVLLIGLRSDLSFMAIIVTLFFPGSLLNGLMTGDFFYRKDLLFLIPVQVVCLGLLWFSNASHPKSLKTVFWIIGVGLGHLALLSHEGFAFIGLPALLLIGHKLLEGLSVTVKKLLFGAGALSFILPLAMVISYPGDAQTSEAIWASLHSTDQAYIRAVPREIVEIDNQHFTEQKYKAISTLSSNLMIEVRWVYLTMLTRVNLVIWVLILSVLFLIFYYWTVLVKGSLRYFYLVFFCGLPLYFVSVDWGRWLSLTFQISMIATLTLNNKSTYQQATNWTKTWFIVFCFFNLFLKLPEGELIKVDEEHPLQSFTKKISR